MNTSGLIIVASALSVVATGFAVAEQTTVDIHRISESGVEKIIGTIAISETKSGASIKVVIAAKGVPAGDHGFHLHEKGSCAPAMKDGKMAAGEAAGPHYDPDKAGSHKGPKGAGHKGDLPLLKATEAGVDQTVVSDRLTAQEIRGRALMIHEGGDTYSENPKDGGGDKRIACAVVPK